MKLFILTYVNIVLLYLVYAVYLTVMTVFAYLISTLFSSTKNAIIFGIISFILLNSIYATREKIKESGELNVTLSTIAPNAGLGMMTYQFLLA